MLFILMRVNFDVHSTIKIYIRLLLNKRFKKPHLPGSNEIFRSVLFSCSGSVTLHLSDLLEVGVASAFIISK